jgi:hypothetical protein
MRERTTHSTIAQGSHYEEPPDALGRGSVPARLMEPIHPSQPVAEIVRSKAGKAGGRW